jgi:internalin A
MATLMTDSEPGRAEALERIEAWDLVRDPDQPLDLRGLHLNTMPTEIGQLTALTTLNLSNNSLTTLPPEIGRLKALTTLSLGSNNLTTLPPEIGQLSALTKLFLHYNQLTALPPEIGRLIALTELFLGPNNLSALPPEIGQLTALRTLFLQNNVLTTLPPEIGQLSSLITLNLHNNDLSALPPEIDRLNALTELYLHDNPGLGLPVEILGPMWNEVGFSDARPKPPQEILAYYFRIHPLTIENAGTSTSGEVAVRGGQLVREGRVIVIGDGGAGKTSLVRALLHGEPARESEDSTRDVVVEDWPDLELRQPGSRAKQAVSVHLWDFGGQEAMHAAHPYFFTTRTLYLVVATARDVGVEDRIAYWLKMVAMHGPGARALVAVNKIDQHPMDIKQGELCASHQDNLRADPAKAFYPISCKGRMKGVSTLRKAILWELQAMDQVWSLVPAEWMAAKTALERRKQENDTLSFEDWAQLCEEAAVPQEERGQALQLMRDLGTVVSFPDDDHLSGLGVLNPSWVTEAIYPLLTSSELAAANGLLEPKDLGKLLKDSRRYPQHKHRWLIELMKKFDLLFENEGRLLLPARLPKDAPSWALDPFWKTADTVQMELRFSVLPESVISKFITRWHEQAWQPESWWRHGIAVKDGKGLCSALLRAHVGDPGRIEINVQGPSVARLRFIAALRGDLEKFTRKLDGELWLLLDSVHPEKYDDLLVLVHEGKEHSIKRVVDGKVREFDLVKALDVIQAEPDQKQELAQINFNVEYMEMHRMSKDIHVGGNVQGSALGDANQITTTSSFNHAADPAAFEQELATFKKQWAELQPKLPEDKREETGLLAERLEEAATKNDPKSRAWYSISAKGLLEASKCVKDLSGNIGGTIANLGKAIWPDFALATSN